jgi:hypothetical protein
MRQTLQQSWCDRPTRAAAAIGSAIGFCLLAGSLAMPDIAWADGAIAIGQPQDIAAEGVSSFIYADASTMESAKAEALVGCKTKTPASSASKALCKVVATFKNQCAAEAYDPKDGTPGFGWAIANTSQEAKRIALANCRDTAGPDRQDACIVPDTGTQCDGSAK